ncbi:uncharacterized protein [Spinacia oleracea]|uniref:Uncharacterized protein n=1 Tax=Spinacia oleracea TaxID=3562 RepID=A0ABM3R4Y8_SPIOL|nr:uncharacterized protein LOC130465887 [Spinacia oleracea]
MKNPKISCLSSQSLTPLTLSLLSLTTLSHSHSVSHSSLSLSGGSRCSSPRRSSVFSLHSPLCGSRFSSLSTVLGVLHSPPSTGIKMEPQLEELCGAIMKMKVEEQVDAVVNVDDPSSPIVASPGTQDSNKV